MMSELLPCPFCGGDVSTPTMQWHGIPIPRCKDCGSEAPSIEAWNRRTPPPATDKDIVDEFCRLGGSVEICNEAWAKGGRDE